LQPEQGGGATLSTTETGPEVRLADVRAAERRGEKLYLLPFWSHRAARPGPGPWVFSQWWPAPFVVDGVRYASAESWMMAAKARLAGDEDVLARILATDDPAEAKALGRQVRGFDARAWEERGHAAVVEGNLAKFSQHPHLGAYLLSTHPAVLVEASPADAVWGIGLEAAHPDARVPSRWPGRNLLGFALMDVRDRLLAGEAA
jgi:ribA/ribD-fused uncharacterized protein